MPGSREHGMAWWRARSPEKSVPFSIVVDDDRLLHSESTFTPPTSFISKRFLARACFAFGVVRANSVKY